MTVVTRTDTAADPRPEAASSRPVYLDYNATAPVDPRVAEEVLTYMAHEFGNAGSRTHGYGQVAKERVNRAREEVAALYVSVEARDLNREEALSRLDDVWEMLEFPAVEVGGQTATDVRQAWEQARRAILVLFEHSDDHEGRPVPSPQ